MQRALAATLAIFLALLALAIARYAPPPPREAPPAEFSAFRAREIQKTIAVAPRPAGSEANARARAYVKEILEGRGFEVDEQHGLACGRWGSCGFATNTIARLSGTDPDADAILLSAHIDSVPAANGANDDGVGTATVIEVARAISEGARPKRTLVVVLTDSEEDGLLGAQLFARDADRTKGIKAVVNVDSRGSTGPSAMFEATPDNAWIVALMAEHLPRPVTTSVFYEVYKRMPNDTDFTAMKRFAVGVNFANVGSIENYHTSHDAIDVADPGTLQHHGDHVLAMVRAFDEANLSEPHHGDAVWFDVMAIGIVRWPERASLPFAIVAFVLVLAHVIRSRYFDRGLASFVAGLAAAIAATAIVTFALRFSGAIGAPWIAHPAFAIAAMLGIALAAALRVQTALRGTPAAAWAGTWLAWAAIGIAASWAMPGACYLFVVPAFVAGVVGFSPARAAMPSVAAFLVMLPMAVQIHDALGFAAPVLPVLFPLLMAGSLAPYVSAVPKRVPLALLVLGAMAALFAIVVPKFSAAHPQRTNVVFRQDDAQSRVHVDTSWGWQRWGKPPASMVRLLDGAADCLPIAFAGLATTCGNAPRVELEPPVLEDVTITPDNGRQVLKARIRSPRGAPRILVELPKGRMSTLLVEGQLTMPNLGFVDVRAVPAEGAAIELTVVGDAFIELTLHDRSFGVPPGAAASIVAARPREAAAYQEGDVTIVSKQVLGPPK